MKDWLGIMLNLTNLKTDLMVNIINICIQFVGIITYKIYDAAFLFNMLKNQTTCKLPTLSTDYILNCLCITSTKKIV